MLLFDKEMLNEPRIPIMTVLSSLNSKKNLRFSCKILALQKIKRWNKKKTNLEMNKLKKERNRVSTTKQEKSFWLNKNTERDINNGSRVRIKFRS